MRHRKGLFVLLAVAVILAAGTAFAYPDKATCSGCHPLDNTVSVVLTFQSCDNVAHAATYAVSVPDRYDAGEGWAVFNGAGSNLAYGYNSGTFTVASSATYTVFGVSDSDAGIGGGKGGSMFRTISPYCGPVCVDADADGYYASTGCGTLVDCNDNDALVYPATLESACSDSRDNDCDGLTDASDPDCAPPPTCTDADVDGYFLEGATCGTAADCNDNNASIHPAPAETACTDAMDNDCDGLIDATDPDCAPPPVCTDADGDGYFAEGGICGPADCNDANNAIHPGATDICKNGIDEDCSGADRTRGKGCPK